MSWVHIHLVTNHIPVIGTIIGLLLLLAAMRWRSQDLKRFALFYFVAIGVFSLLVFFTGEPAEESIEHVAGISEAVIERHEEASIFGLIAVEILAVMSAIGLLSRQKIIASESRYTTALLIMALVSSGTMVWIANLGGKIRHTEIASQSQSVESEDD